MENPTKEFYRGEPCASAHIRIANYKENCEELELAKRGLFCAVYFVGRKFFLTCFIPTYNVLSTPLEYTYFYISKEITSYIFLLVFKIVESLQCIH